MGEYDDEMDKYVDLPPYRRKQLEKEIQGCPKAKLKQMVHSQASELANLKRKSKNVANQQRRAQYKAESQQQQLDSESGETERDELRQEQADRWKIACLQAGGNSRTAKSMEAVRMRSESVGRPRQATPQPAISRGSSPSKQRSNKFELKSARHAFGLVNVKGAAKTVSNDDEYFFWKAWNSAHFRHSPSKLSSIKVPWVSAARLTAQLRTLNMTPITFDQPTSSIEGYFVGELDAPTITNALSTLSIHDLIAVHRATRACSVVPRVTVMARVNVNTTTWRMEYELKTEVPFIMQAFAQYFESKMLDSGDQPLTSKTVAMMLETQEQPLTIRLDFDQRLQKVSQRHGTTEPALRSSPSGSQTARSSSTPRRLSSTREVTLNRGAAEMWGLKLQSENGRVTIAQLQEQGVAIKSLREGEQAN